MYGGDVGGLLEAMLHPVGNFGKFLTVLLWPPNIAASFYSVSLKVLVPFLVVVPRYVFSIVVMANRRSCVHCRCAPILRNDYQFPSGYATIVSLEHLLFRKNDPENYNAEIWDIPAKLPMEIAALAAGIGSFGLVIPCMHQTWFFGPIARSTGDIGFEVAFAVSAMLYAPFRWLEIRWKGII